MITTRQPGYYRVRFKETPKILEWAFDKWWFGDMELDSRYVECLEESPISPGTASTKDVLKMADCAFNELIKDPIAGQSMVTILSAFTFGFCRGVASNSVLQFRKTPPLDPQPVAGEKEQEEVWLSVEDALPVKSGNYKVKVAYSKGIEVRTFDGGFYNYDGYKVTHWQLSKNTNQ